MFATESRTPNSYELGSYFPSIPPLTPDRCVSFPRAVEERVLMRKQCQLTPWNAVYLRAVEDAPRSALLGVLVYDDDARMHPVSPRHRDRHRVGVTNRWRLPQTLLSDCLGSTQAIKSLYPANVPYHKTMINILTADNPKLSVNLDVDVPYSVRADRILSGRPYSTPAAADMPLTPTFSRVNTVNAVIPRTDPRKSNFQYSRPATKNARVPSTVHFTRPTDILHYHSKYRASNDPEKPECQRDHVLLDCLGMSWELHRPFIKHSKTLSELLERTERPKPTKQYKTKISQQIDRFITSNDSYSTEYREISQKLCLADSNEDDKARQPNANNRTKSQNLKSNVTRIALKVDDPSITRRALAIALGHLYHENTEVPKQDIAAVMAAANALKFQRLVNNCADLMLKTINPGIVCRYYKVAHKCKQERVMTACRRWLELNLIPQMSAQIYLREIPIELLGKVLKSNRLFTYSEYWVYRTVAYWTFLQLNPSVQLMPSYSTVLTYFNSLGKSAALVEREEGKKFAPLFMALRLHGITESSHMQDMQTMNIIPQSWIVKLLSEHCHSLQGGGDMSLMTNFSGGSIRKGFIIDEEPHYHSEVLTLHGFNFELKAIRKEGSYSFSIQRIKPNDPILSFKQCERQTFSMRQNREVCYSIRVQHVDKSSQCHSVSSGMLIENFGFGTKTCKSKVLTLDGLNPPIYVTYSILFPPS